MSTPPTLPNHQTLRPIGDRSPQHLVDAMTAQEIVAKLRAIATIIGTELAHVSLCLSSNSETASVLVNVNWPSAPTEHFRFKSLPEAFAAALEWAQTRPKVERNATIRRMALAIIELTDEHGECTAAMLRRKDFTDARVAELHAEACVRAGEMCQGAPFSVLFV